MAASRCAVGGKKKPRGSREREGDALQGPNGRFVACVLGDAESVKGPHDLPCHLFRVSPSAVLRAVGSPFSRGLPSQVVAFLRQQGAGELGTTPEMRTSQLRRGKWVICICIGQILQRLGRPRGSSLGRGAPALVFEEGGRGEGGVRRAAGYNWHGQRWFVRRVDRYSRASGDDPDQALGPRSSLHLEQVRTEETARSLCVEGRRTLLLKLLFLPSPSLSVNLTISSPPPSLLPPPPPFSLSNPQRDCSCSPHLRTPDPTPRFGRPSRAPSPFLHQLRPQMSQHVRSTSADDTLSILTVRPTPLPSPARVAIGSGDRDIPNRRADFATDTMCLAFSSSKHPASTTPRHLSERGENDEGAARRAEMRGRRRCPPHRRRSGTPFSVRVFFLGPSPPPGVL